MDQPSKKCTRCGVDFPLDSYARDARRSDGRRAACKSCESRDVTASDLIEDIIAGGLGMAAFGSPLERLCAEQLLVTGSIEAAAELAGVTPRVLRAHLTELRRKAAARGFAPTSDMTKPTPDGFHVKGVSTLYDGAGNVRSQWVKTKADDHHRLSALLDAMSHIADSWESMADPVARPVRTNDRLMCVYPMGDPHVGMFAWGEETGGDDFDLPIAERTMCEAVDQLVALAPPAKRALLIDLGDYFHADNMDNRTARSGHALDVDTRYIKVVRVGVRAARRWIDRSLQKHAEVDFWCVGGNHDDISSIMLAICLQQFYEREPRVHVHAPVGAFHYMRFGNNLFGATHGHTVKAHQLGPVMACDRAKDWGETLYRRFFTGHVHHETLKEFPGLTVETARTLAPADAWHAASGYRSGRDMKCYTWHEIDGLIATNIVNADAIKRAIASRSFNKE